MHSPIGHSYPWLRTGVEKQGWVRTDDLIAVVEIFAGMQGEFYDKLTGGQVETKAAAGLKWCSGTRSAY